MMMGVNTRNMQSCLQKSNKLNKSHLVGRLLNSSCKYIKVYFTCCLCKRKLLRIVSLGFDEMGQLLVIYFGFGRYWREKGIGGWDGGMEYNEAGHRIHESL